MPPLDRLVLLAVLPAAAGMLNGQTAGARSVVAPETVPYFSRMDEKQEPAGMLRRGDVLDIGLVLFGQDVTWCAVTRPGDTRRLGYVACEALRPYREPEPAPEPPPPPPPPPTPVVREVEPVPMPVVREAPAIPPLPEPPAERDVPALVAALLEHSGESVLIEQFSRTNLIGFLDKSRVADAGADAIAAAIGKHFRPSLFLSAIRSEFEEAAHAEHTAPLSQWIDSLPALRAGQLIRQATGNRKDLEAYAAALIERPPAEERLRLIHRLVDARRVPDRDVETSLALVRSLAQALNPRLPAARRYHTRELDEALGTVKEKYLRLMRNASIVAALFTFDTFSDEELDQYVRFWESPAGAWWVRVLDRGFARAAGRAGRDLFVEITLPAKEPAKKNATMPDQ